MNNPKVRPLHDVDVFIGSKPWHGTVWMFHCPACGYGHWFAEGTWSWNQDVTAPTVNPSILTNQCHLFIRNGKLEFCSDSAHAMAGKTVDMVDWT